MAKAKKKRAPARNKKHPYGKGDTSWFVQDRFGMFIHWGLYALGARHEWLKNKERMTTETYQRYFDRFNPDLYDPKAWARAAKQAGMKYFVVTTRHHDGFCLWKSKYTDYHVGNTPYGKDLLKPMVKAFRDEGIKVGFYYSLLDWHHEDYPVDRCHPQAADKAFRENTKGRDVRKYAAYMRNQVEELLTNFGRIDVLWFDFSFPGEDGKDHNDWESEKMIKLVRKLQPHIVLNNRLNIAGAEDIETPEQFIPAQGLTDSEGKPVVWEGCQTFSGSWGYHRDEASWKPVEMCVEMLIEHVSKGGNLLLNVGPTARGLIDDRALDRLDGLAEWMELHSRSIYGCGSAPEGMPAAENTRYTYNPTTNRLYVHVLSWPFKHLLLPGLNGKIAYAQLLNDASELKIREAAASEHSNLSSAAPEGAAKLVLPVARPEVAVPVIEVFLK